jgi:periplasmic protein TonB
MPTLNLKPCFLRAPNRQKSKSIDAVVGLCVLMALGTAGCNKAERVPTTTERLKSVEQLQSTQPDFYVPRKTVDYMADLKIAPKEAPARTETLSEPVKPERAKADAAKIEAVKAEAAKLETARLEAARVEASRIEAARVEAARLETAKAAAPSPVIAIPPPAPAPATVPRVIEPIVVPRANEPTPPPAAVAAAAPTAARPAPEATSIVNVITREQPEFPRDAIRQGVENGTVRARLTIGATGDVTKVTVLQAQPPRVFDRAVTTSLSRWKFNPGTEGRSYDTEISFKR